jgi:hypothetical protein
VTLAILVEQHGLMVLGTCHYIVARSAKVVIKSTIFMNHNLILVAVTMYHEWIRIDLWQSSELLVNPMVILLPISNSFSLFSSYLILSYLKYCNFTLI